MNRALAQSRLPTAHLVDWVRERRPNDATFFDPAHPMGSTRMADNEHHGVVDREALVFDVDNLYIAGSSAFPTGSHANPTLMIVALALRLADTVRRRLETNAALRSYSENRSCSESESYRESESYNESKEKRKQGEAA